MPEVYGSAELLVAAVADGAGSLASHSTRTPTPCPDPRSSRSSLPA